MNLLHTMDGLRLIPPGATVSIGNFDGIHVGHAEILRQARQLASGQAVGVITFEPHPMTVLRPNHVPPRLTDLHRKRELLESAGVDYLVELAPTPDVLGLSAERFWEIIRDEVRPNHLIEGVDFRFGKGRRGNIDLLRDWSAQSDVQLHVLEDVEATLLDQHVVPVSSSLIRWLVGNGRMRDAAICLGRPYVLTGVVVEGFRRGRELGIPTANLLVSGQAIPMEGVYAGKCSIGAKTYSAAISVGKPPTFEAAEFQIEAHLMGFDGDLYGQTLNLEIRDWVRDQRKYSNVEALKEQMNRDLQSIGSRP
ncbi:MAG TPA: riboflavin biosynthesis protein RibF [Tepidisphaeraceae bacterium]|nr:riboflavin biosynthesis protein RibF [Tepidisphaeraceae bacterium]